MKNILQFLIDVGSLKEKERRGWIVHQIENPETTAEHIFHLAILVWVVGKEKDDFDLNRAIKMALVHDMCEVYSKDITPYDPLLPEDDDPEKAKEVLEKWPDMTPEMKIKKEKEKRKMEKRGLEKLLSKMPEETKKEMKDLWMEYEKKVTSESRFVKQADKMINFLQGIEYYKKEGKIKHKLWVRWIKEIIDDPDLISLLQEIEKTL